MFVHPEQVAEAVKCHGEVTRARLVVSHDGQSDVTTLKAEVPAGTDQRLAAHLANSLAAVTKLRGFVELVPADSLLKDGKVIENVHKYERTPQFEAAKVPTTLNEYPAGFDGFDRRSACVSAEEGYGGKAGPDEQPVVCFGLRAAYLLSVPQCGRPDTVGRQVLRQQIHSGYSPHVISGSS